MALQRLRAQADVVGLEDEAAAQARVVVRELLLGLGVQEVRFLGDDAGALTKS